MVKLARRLALGLITVRLDDGLVAVHCDPGSFQPRKVKARQAKLLRQGFFLFVFYCVYIGVGAGINDVLVAGHEFVDE